MDKTDTVVARLREATGQAHAGLETDAEIIARLSSASARQALIAGYEDLYAGAARLLAPWFDGIDTQSAPISSDLGDTLNIRTRAEALGFRYVIEGSALGGHVIVRQLRALGVDMAGLGFLDPHGARVGEVWRDFCGLLERELASPPDAIDEAVAGAVKGFAYARSCLMAGQPVAWQPRAWQPGA